MKAQMQKGFTLIELMIVVAIIGILAAIAIPQYQNYVAKSQVSRVMSEAGALKTAVESCMLEGVSTTCTLGWSASNLLTGAAVSTGQTGLTVDIDTAANTATIEATFGQNAAATLSTKKLAWYRGVNGAWSCGTDVDAKYRPTGCSSDLAAAETEASEEGSTDNSEG